MAIPTKPVPIKRIGLVLELEDGSKVMVYADHLRPDAQVTVTTDVPVGSSPWGWDRPSGTPETSILIEGVGSYRFQRADADTKVSHPGRNLEAIRRAVQ